MTGPISDRDTIETPSRICVSGVFRDVTGKPFYADGSAVRLLNRLFRTEEYLTCRLPIFRLNATQTDVSSDFREAPRRYQGAHDELPAVVKYDGRYYIVDGHHRLMAAADAGAATAAVRLYDLDGNTQQDFPLLDHIVNRSPSILADSDRIEVDQPAQPCPSAKEAQ